MGGRAYMIHRADSPKWNLELAGRGILRAGGEFWNRADKEWQGADMPRDIFSPSEKAAYPLPTGGVWIEILVEQLPDNR